MKTKHITATAVLIFIAFLLLGIYFFFQPKPENFSWVHPPITAADVPYATYTIENQKGGTISYASGSTIVIPANAFLDEKGQPVKGNVEVKYREFADQLDIFLSGIPMVYDSGGHRFNFESAGMCDFTASQKGTSLQINPQAPLTINMVSGNSDNDFSLYYLDKEKQQWINKGVAKLSVVNPEIGADPALPPTPEASLVKPVMPEKITGDMPVIKVKIDSNAYAELKDFDNLQFQLDEKETRFHPEDANVEWEDFRLNKRNGKGLYEICFSTKKQSKSYLAKPVLDEKDFNKGLINYQLKLEAYEKKMKEIELQRENWVKFKKEEDKRNKQQLMEKSRKEDSLITAENEKTKQYNINGMSRTLRSFDVRNFGVWNCDRRYKDIFIGQFQIAAIFVNEQQQTLQMNNVNVFHKALNGLVPMESNTVTLFNNNDNFIIGMQDDRFYYIMNKDIKGMKLNEHMKKARFVMKVVEGKNLNYDYLRKLIFEHVPS